MSALAQQLDLFNDNATPVCGEYRPGMGRVLYTAAGGWLARWTGERWGWVFYRAIMWNEPQHEWLGSRWSWQPHNVVHTEWETWEPNLPFGVEHVADRPTATALLEGLVVSYGDDPAWLLHRA